MKNSLSRRIYNSSLTLAISFGFYALIFAFTLSCDAEEGSSPPANSATEEATPLTNPNDTSLPPTDDAVSYVENITN